MIRNYLKIAFRNLIRQKGYSFINIFGLSFGLTCCLLITLYVRYELSYDHFHNSSANIYRVVEDIATPDGTSVRASAAGPVAPALVSDFPEIVRATRLMGKATMLMQHGENKFQENNIYFADSTVFSVFTFPFLKGDPQTALTAPSSVVLTESTAQRYFGNADPLNKTLTIDNGTQFTVKGVMRDVPANSHLRFDMLVSLTTMGGGDPTWLQGWFWSASTYIQLAPGYQAENLESKFAQFVKRHLDNELLKKGGKRILSLQPLTDIHLYSKREGEKEKPGSVSNLYLFSFIAIFILLIACVNFINLATAQASRRAREVGMRKVMGGTRAQLTFQFLAESMLLSVGASILALICCYFILPSFIILTGIPVSMLALASPLTIAALLGISLLVGCLAGSYPAFLLSGFLPASVLKGNVKTTQGNILRKGLIVFQFSTSVILIIGTITVFSQLKYMQKEDLGYNREQMLVLSFGDDELVQEKVEVIKQELLRSPYIKNASASSHIPGKEPGNTRIEIENAIGAIQVMDTHLLSVDYDFLPLYDIKLLAGRTFSTEYAGDDTEGLILNETAAKQFGFRQPGKLIGKQVSMGDNKGIIIGVVKDFHYTSLHQLIEPLAIRMRSKSLSYISMPLRSETVEATLKDLQQRWQAMAPHRPFDYFFLDEQFDQQYKADKQFGEIFGVSATIAIVLACLGLFALASFTVQQRTREIGIRKVLGASVSGVTALLSKDFIKLVLISIIIASPVAWYMMDKWLQDFAYRIDQHWWMYAFAGLLTVVIAILTVSFQSVRAALMNPVKSLKAE